MKATRATLSLGLLGAFLLAPSSKPSPAAVPRPSLDRGCAACHSETAREWEASLHHRSATDPAFVRAFEREPLPFCRRCHAPATTEGGIGCTDCHVGVSSDHGPLATKARSCADCHEFSFPSGAGWMQKTATEHRASAFADTSCASCHMTKQQGHRFEITASMMTRALVADISRAGASRIAVRLKPGAVGHAVPTGDLFRRLLIEAESLDDDGDRITRRRRYLSRHFTSGTELRTEGPDDRVGGSALEPCFELDLGRLGRDRPVRVTIAHERVQEPRSVREEDALVFARTPILERRIDALSEERPCRR